ncbi:GATA zinc finger domain-containing protein 14-like [Schistocerca gregaria]|uniref:GATA zinc finger domain-containing protein 14-like n=1 Tax=Schistocerca gregaria TaxID=7010 RepID=UPI00211EBD24|nr:GATA zinc finger domain-containing protein 14-like [Schistocerca gregaria]
MKEMKTSLEERTDEIEDRVDNVKDKLIKVELTIKQEVEETAKYFESFSSERKIKDREMITRTDLHTKNIDDKLSLFENKVTEKVKIIEHNVDSCNNVIKDNEREVVRLQKQLNEIQDNLAMKSVATSFNGFWQERSKRFNGHHYEQNHGGWNQNSNNGNNGRQNNHNGNYQQDRQGNFQGDFNRGENSNWGQHENKGGNYYGGNRNRQWENPDRRQDGNGQGRLN